MSSLMMVLRPLLVFLNDNKSSVLSFVLMSAVDHTDTNSDEFNTNIQASHESGWNWTVKVTHTQTLIIRINMYSSALMTSQ